MPVLEREARFPFQLQKRTFHESTLVWLVEQMNSVVMREPNPLSLLNHEMEEDGFPRYRGKSNPKTLSQVSERRTWEGKEVAFGGMYEMSKGVSGLVKVMIGA
jgi:hypothetical protein